jgi:ABC-type nitrate/sulfonate/bicarbonate transport system permease component
MVIIVCALALWEGSVRMADVPKWLLPAPSAIGIELYDDAGLLMSHAAVTIKEVVVGFALAFWVGVVLAVAIAYSRLLERTVYPFVIASQTIPIIAIAPLLLIWLGYGLSPKVIVVALISFFPIVVNMVDGLKAVDSDMVAMMRTLGASRWQIFTKLQVPSSLPFLFSGTKVGIAVSVIGAVIGEWVGGRAGLGYLMTISVPYFLTARVFAAVFILSLMGIALFLAVTILERLLLRWYHTEQRQKAMGG